MPSASAAAALEYQTRMRLFAQEVVEGAGKGGWDIKRVFQSVMNR
jgi:hypothetical protein